MIAKNKGPELERDLNTWVDCCARRVDLFWAWSRGEVPMETLEESGVVPRYNTRALVGRDSGAVELFLFDEEPQEATVVRAYQEHHYLPENELDMLLHFSEIPTPKGRPFLVAVPGIRFGSESGQVLYQVEDGVASRLTDGIPFLPADGPIVRSEEL